MNLSRLLLLATLIVPWFSLQLLGKKTIKRFFPNVVIITLVTQAIQSMAKKRSWWLFHKNIHPKIAGSIPFTYGVEPITAFWLLKWTYGKFLLFLISNGILHYVFAYPTMKLFTRLGLSTLGRLSNGQFFLLLFVRGILLYCLQWVKEKFFTKKKKLFW